MKAIHVGAVDLKDEPEHIVRHVLHGGLAGRCSGIVETDLQMDYTSAAIGGKIYFADKDRMAQSSYGRMFAGIWIQTILLDEVKQEVVGKADLPPLLRSFGEICGWRGGK